MSNFLNKYSIIFTILIILLGGLWYKKGNVFEKTELPKPQNPETTLESSLESTEGVYDSSINVYKGTLSQLTNFLRESKEIFNQYELPQHDIMVTPVLYVSQTPNTKSAGMAIYNHNTDQILWNIDLSTSSEMFMRYPKILEVRDINNDGKSDLLAYWNDASNDPFVVLKIFTVNNNLEVNSIRIGEEEDFGGTDVTFSDIDNDKVEEIISTKNVWNQTGDSKYDVETVVITSTYKWNGTEYVLWKEQQEPFDGTPQ